MYQQILVAFDGSEISQKALNEAIRLAAQWQSHLRIVHVVDEVSLNHETDFADLGKVTSRFRESGLKVLEQADAIARQAGANYETKLLEIDRLTLHIPDLIAAEADAWPADLIVIGSHGRRGMRRLILGSVAEGVARISSKPLLLIRGE
ncbi:MAG: universal stress protein [Gammaproteobacteria bacterium]